MKVKRHVHLEAPRWSSLLNTQRLFSRDSCMGVMLKIKGERSTGRPDWGERKSEMGRGVEQGLGTNVFRLAAIQVLEHT